MASKSIMAQKSPASDFLASGEKRMLWRHILKARQEDPEFASGMEQSLAVNIVGPAAPGIYARFHYDENKDLPLSGTQLRGEGRNWDVSAGDLNLDFKSGLLLKNRDMMGLHLNSQMGRGKGWAMMGELEGVLYRQKIRGNGRKGPYLLDNGGILYASETVMINGQLLARNKDYTMDLDSGILWFSRPLARGREADIAYDYQDKKNRTVAGAGFEHNWGRFLFDGCILTEEIGGIKGFERGVSNISGSQLDLQDERRIEDLGMTTFLGNMALRFENARSLENGELKGQAYEGALVGDNFQGAIRWWDQDFIRIDKSSSDLKGELQLNLFFDPLQSTGNKKKEKFLDLSLIAREAPDNTQSAALIGSYKGFAATAEVPEDLSLKSRYILEYQGERNNLIGDHVNGHFSFARSFIQEGGLEDSANLNLGLRHNLGNYGLFGNYNHLVNPNERNGEIMVEGKGPLSLPWIFEARAQKGEISDHEFRGGFKSLWKGWSIFPYALYKNEKDMGEANRLGLESRKIIGSITLFAESYDQKGFGEMPSIQWFSLGIRGRKGPLSFNGRLNNQNGSEGLDSLKSRLSVDSRWFNSNRIRLELTREHGENNNQESIIAMDRKGKNGLTFSASFVKQKNAEGLGEKVEMAMVASL